MILLLLILVLIIFVVFSNNVYGGDHIKQGRETLNATQRGFLQQIEDRTSVKLPIYDSVIYAPYNLNLNINRKGVQHWGQRKLLLSEIEFLTNHSQDGDLVVYIGSAGGYHFPIIAEMFKKLEYHLWDPAFSIDTKLQQYIKWKGIENIKIEADYFKDESCERYTNCGKRVLFISDIRIANNTVGSEDIEENGKNGITDLSVDKDMLLQAHCILKIQPAASMVKFKTPITFGGNISKYFSPYVYLDGKIQLQQLTSPSSLETRLISTKPYKQKVWDPAYYEGKMFMFNSFYRYMCYSNENAGNSGMCNCYNCASETRIINEYKSRYNDNRPVGWFVDYFTEITNIVQGSRHYIHENYTTKQNILVKIPEYVKPLMNRSYVYGDNATSSKSSSKSAAAPKDPAERSARVVVKMEVIEGVRNDSMFRALPKGKDDPKCVKAVDASLFVSSDASSEASSEAPVGVRSVADGVASSEAPVGVRSVADYFPSSAAPVEVRSVADGVASSEVPVGVRSSPVRRVDSASNQEGSWRMKEGSWRKKDDVESSSEGASKPWRRQN